MLVDIAVILDQLDRWGSWAGSVCCVCGVVGLVLALVMQTPRLAFMIVAGIGIACGGAAVAFYLAWHTLMRALERAVRMDA